jgi:hypothetical protein
MSEMIERVEAAMVRALAASDGGSHIETKEGETVIDGRFDLSAVARAVLVELREPTDAMWDALDAPEHGGRYEESMGYILNIDTWRIMIDAALK